LYFLALGKLYCINYWQWLVFTEDLWTCGRFLLLWNSWSCEAKQI